MDWDGSGGCTPSTGPDVIVGDLIGIQKFGTVGTITAYAIGTESGQSGVLTIDDIRLYPDALVDPGE